MTRLELNRVKGRELRRVQMSFIPGVVHALVGGPDEEGAEFVAICAGIVRPKRGTVRLNENSPFQSPETRRRIGALLRVEAALEGESVEVSVAHALGIHESRVGAREALTPFGLESLLSRSPASLSPYETRSVALALALALEAPLLLVLHEPFAAGLPRAEVKARLSERAAGGSIVLAVMASGREAAESGAELVSLRSSSGGLAPSKATAPASGVPS